MATEQPVYVSKWNAYTPLGESISELFGNMKGGKSSCLTCFDDSIYPESFCASRFINYDILNDGFTLLEDFIITCLDPILDNETAEDSRTIFIFSTTKGNIDKLKPGESLNPETYLWYTAGKIAAHYKNPNAPITISNACVSGIMAQNLGSDLIRSGRYNTAIVFGADILSSFVISGFGSFKAMSAEPCKPFDLNRTGINLGEGAGAVILSSNAGKLPIRITGTGSGNDANHISGPSRTGEGLSIAIHSALSEGNCMPETVDFISAHGTATSYNDEMESMAFMNSGLSRVPLNSMKGYFGHTLGAAGLIETAVLLESMKQGILLPSLGFSESGVTGEITVLKEIKHQTFRKALKTGSGFGGCNAATLFEKD